MIIIHFESITAKNKENKPMIDKLLALHPITSDPSFSSPILTILIILSSYRYTLI